MTMHVVLREVVASDLPIFYEHQRDPQSVAMADFPSRDREAHMAHWARIMAVPSSVLRTIVFNGEVAGNIVSWDGSDGREVGYWLGRQFWGQGIASQALALFLDEVRVRPLFAHVVKHNVASRRVLEKCGFVVTRAAGVQPEPGAEPIAEFILRLD